MSPPLRVLIVSHLATMSGAEQALLRLVTHYDRQRVHPIVVLPTEGPLLDEIKAVGIDVRVLPLGWWIPASNWNAQEYLAQLEGLAGRAAALARLAIDERIEVIHTNTIVTFEGAMAAAAAGVPHLWHSRGPFAGPFPPKYVDWRYFMRAVDLLADELVCVSKQVARQASEVCRLTRVEVVYDGVDVEGFRRQPVAPRESIAAELRVPPGARIIACVGGIQRRKRQIDLVDAMSILIRQHPDAVAVLVGTAPDPEYAAAVDARISELRLHANVKRVGFWRDVRSLLAASEVMAQPSDSEGCSLAVLEALAAGVPVVATPVGADEQLEDGKSGMLVPIGDAKALAAALDVVLRDRSRRESIGRAAAERAQFFDMSVAARRTQERYEAVLADAARARAWQPLRERTAAVFAEDVVERARRAAEATSASRL